MNVTYMILGFTSLILLSTFLYYRYAMKKGIEFRYKPIFLLIILLLFIVSLYGAITGTPYNEVVSFIG